MLRMFGMVLLACFCVACAKMNSEFDCKKMGGINCESLDQINARVDRGEFSKSLLPNNTLAVPPVQAKTVTEITNVSTKSTEVRVPETVQKIWVAPFEDAQGNYHKESEIYTVTKKGFWAQK